MLKEPKDFSHKRLFQRLLFKLGLDKEKDKERIKKIH